MAWGRSSGSDQASTPAPFAGAWAGAKGGPLVYHSYEGKKSAPEFGVNLSRRNLEALERYRLERMIGLLTGAEPVPEVDGKEER